MGISVIAIIANLCVLALTTNNVQAIELGSIGSCQGTCLKDRHCAWGLNCYKVNIDGDLPVPGCTEVHPEAAEGYCYHPPSEELVIVAGYNGLPEEAFPLQACQGGCRHDGDCDYGLSCFQRDGMEEIPGCTGLGQFKWDYCYSPKASSHGLVLQNPDNQLGKLQACQGECFRDSDCDWGLTCFSRKADESVPGCDGIGAPGKNYCHFPTDPKELVLMGHKGLPETAFPLDECQGDCNSDLDCREGLVCRQRYDDAKVAGCSGRGQGGKDYCARPTDNQQLAVLTDSTYPDTTNSTIFPLLPCQGHCTCDDDCIGDYSCIERNEDTAAIIPGCAESDSAPFDINYCSGVTYFPGVGSNFEHGIQLSQGLTARVLARSGRLVRLLGGQKSSQVFHNLPDGAAVFADPSGSGGWAYVSNSEDDQDGGVGALYFDQNGQVIQYKRLLAGTKRNCGGGKTFWNTFLTCEERLGGKVWEVDPWAEAVQSTLIDDSVGSYYESAAYDNRRPETPNFFFTMDYESGPLLRFSPDPLAVDKAQNSQDFSNLLQGAFSNNYTNSSFEYLVLDFNSTFVPSSDSHLGCGTFHWSKSFSQASDSAFLHYKNSEGIDIRDGILYFTTKRDKVRPKYYGRMNEPPHSTQVGL